MTAEEFRELALSLPGVVEGAHMRHADFRAHGRIFATLGYPDDAYGMVKLEPADQKRLVEQFGQIFVPVKGAWGALGCTSVKLAAGERGVVLNALDHAWQKSAADAMARSAAKGASLKKLLAGKALGKGMKVLL